MSQNRHGLQSHDCLLKAKPCATIECVELPVAGLYSTPVSDSCHLVWPLDTTEIGANINVHVRPRPLKHNGRFGKGHAFMYREQGYATPSAPTLMGAAILCCRSVYGGLTTAATMPVMFL